jgi:hypothetical protein
MSMRIVNALANPIVHQIREHPCRVIIILALGILGGGGLGAALHGVTKSLTISLTVGVGSTIVITFAFSGLFICEKCRRKDASGRCNDLISEINCESDNSKKSKRIKNLADELCRYYEKGGRNFKLELSQNDLQALIKKLEFRRDCGKIIAHIYLDNEGLNFEADYASPISGEMFDDPVVTSCFHRFDREELKSWFDTQTKNGNTRTCPNCRRENPYFDENNDAAFQILRENITQAIAYFRKKGKRSRG